MDATQQIKDYVKSLDKPDNEIYQKNSLLIQSCFSKALEIIEETNTYLLCEAIADISFLAGQYSQSGDFTGSGNSREDISNFIQWAMEFEKINKGVEWGVDIDYIDSIEKFTWDKMLLEVRIDKSTKIF